MRRNPKNNCKVMYSCCTYVVQVVDRCNVIVLYLVLNVYLVLHRYYGKSHGTKVLCTTITSFCCSSDIWIPLPPTLSNLCVSNSHCTPPHLLVEYITLNITIIVWAICFLFDFLPVGICEFLYSVNT